MYSNNFNELWSTDGYFRSKNWASIPYSGVIHREDGPAIIWAGGKIDWYINGMKLTLERFIYETPYLKTDAERTMFYLKWK